MEKKKIKQGRPIKKYPVGDSEYTMEELVTISGKHENTMRVHLKRYYNQEITEPQLLGQEPIPVRGQRAANKRILAERARARRILDSIPSAGSWEKQNLHPGEKYV